MINLKITIRLERKNNVIFFMIQNKMGKKEINGTSYANQRGFNVICCNRDMILLHGPICLLWDTIHLFLMIRQSVFSEISPSYSFDCCVR